MPHAKPSLGLFLGSLLPRPLQLPLVLSFGAVVLLGSVGCEESTGDFGATPKTDADKVGVKQADPAAAEGDPNAAPDFDKALALAPAYDKASGQLVVTLAIQDGFHAYAPGNEIGVPVSMAVSEEGGWKVEGDVSIPAGEKKDLGELGTALILEGQVPISATVKGGAGKIAGSMGVQICTKSVCDRPKQHKFEVAVPES